jgi:phosphoglycerate dehydrogenase-like enzyme
VLRFDRCSRMPFAGAGTPESLAAGGDAHQELLDASVLLADPGAVVSIIDDAAKLQWMQSTWAGVNVLFSDTAKRDYVCTRVAGIFGAPAKSASCHCQSSIDYTENCTRSSLVRSVTGPLMAEYVLGYILLLERKLLLAKSQQEAKVYPIPSYRPPCGFVLTSTKLCASVSVPSRRGWKSHSRKGRAHWLG